MHLRNCILFIILSFFGTVEFFAQCSITRNIPIADNDTTYISILVEGLTNDSLGNPGQGLCGVNIDFRHEFIGDVSLELFSPSGQNIQLTGPAVSVSGNTSFTRWDVFFIPCNDSPLPDPGFTDIWNNLQPWGLFGNYSGQYHPFQGCLEQFNSGTANGTWTLRVADVSQFGAGRIQSVTLFFCDDDGVQCSDCKLDPGNMSATPIEQCQNSSAIVFENYQETFPVYPKDTQNYFYHWALFQDTSWVDLVPQNFLSDLPVGEYRLCNLQYAKLEADNLPAYPANFDIKSLNQYFNDSLLCARVGDSCINISIYPTSDTLLIDTTICQGESLIYLNQFFTQEGEYFLSLPGQFCDTILVLNLHIKDLKATILTNHDTISCTNREVMLQGLIGDTSVVNPDFYWFTNNGVIIPPVDSSVVQVQSKGIYFLVISDSICSDTTSIEIFFDDNFPVVEIQGEATLTCFLDTIVLTAVTDENVISFNWYSMVDFINLGNQIMVYQPGKYFVEMTNEDSCKAVATFQIFQIDSIAPFTISVDTLQCGMDSAFIYLNHSDSGSYLYNWTGVETGYENLKDVLTTTGGLKTVDVLDTKTGCRLMDSIVVSDEREYPNIEVNVQNLTCNIDSVIPGLEIDIPVDEYFWVGPGLNSSDSTVIIRNPGTYTVRVTTQEGCFSEKIFSVLLDTIKANLVLSTDTLTCNRDSVFIDVVSDKPLMSYFWYGPGGQLLSTSNRPAVNVSGLYSLHAIDENGCLSIQTIEIVASGELPNIEFAFDNITCGSDSVQIQVSKESGYSFLWEFPDMTTSVLAEPVVYLPGIYKVTVTDISQPECVEFKELKIYDTRQFVTLEKIYGDLTCSADSVLVQIISDLDSIKLVIQGPSFYAEDTFNFYVFEIGTYIIEAISKEGCTTIDSFVISLNDLHPNINIVSVSEINCSNPKSTVRIQSDIIGTRFEIYRGVNLVTSGSNVNIGSPGDFIVYGIAPNFCRDTTYFTILIDTIKPDLSILPFDTITCMKPIIELEAYSDFPEATIHWLHSNINPNEVLSGGIYTAQAIHPHNGCLTEKSIEVVEQKIFAEYSVQTTKITCKNDNAFIEIVTGDHFENIVWSDTNPFTVTQGTLSFFTQKDGVYYFEVISQQECVLKDSVIILKDTIPPVIIDIQGGELNCIDSQVEISISSSSALDSVIWQKPDGTLSYGISTLATHPGMYRVRLYGENGCLKDTFFSVNQNLDLPVFTTFTDSLSCKKGKGFIGVQTSENNLMYEWRGPSSFYSNLENTLITEPGIYTVVVTKLNGCKDSAEILVIGDYIVPKFEIKDTFFIPCDSSLIVLELTEIDEIEQYYWALNGNFFSIENAPTTNQPGVYTVIITGVNGCRATRDFLAQQVTLPIGFSFTTDTITCAQKEVILTAHSPHSDAEFTWISPGGNLFFTNQILTDESGIFLLIVKDDFNCLDTVGVVVETDTIPPYVEIEQSGQVICDNLEIELLIDGEFQHSNYTFFWFGNNLQILSDPSLPKIRVRGEGVFRVLVHDIENGCKETFNYMVEKEESDFNHLPISVQQPLCPEFNFGSITIGTLSGVAPYEVFLNGNNYQSTFAFYLLSPGPYTLVVRDDMGCATDTTIVIHDQLPLSFYLPTDTTLLLGDSLVFDMTTDSLIFKNFNVIWLEKSDTICSGDCPKIITVFPKLTTKYTLKLVSRDGNCLIEKNIFVNVRDEIFSGIPNSFALNATNELNRVFYIPQIRGIDKIVSMEIYDKWANPMFARYDFNSGDPGKGWDGTYNGTHVEEGVYVVICKLKLSNGNTVTYEGDVTFIK